MKRKLLLRIVIMSLILIPLSASAFEINDTGSSAYWGGRVMNAGATVYEDEISGQLEEFSVDTLKAEVIGANYVFTLRGDYFSSYINNIGLAGDYGPGDLYLSTSGWHTNSTADQYAYDTFDANEGWNYVISFGEEWEIYENEQYVSVPALFTLEYAEIEMTNAPPNYIYRSQQAWNGGYGDFVSVAEVTLSGDTLVFSIPTSELRLNLDQIGYHWAMQCGNDVVEGGGTPVPEPTTILLLGLGLLGLGLARRKG